MSKRYDLDHQKFLLPEELAQFHLTLKTATKFNRVLIQTLLHTGARAQEVLNIRASDLNTSAKTVLIHGLKKSNNRELPLPSRLFAEIYALAAENVTLTESRPFPISYQRLYQIWVEHCPVKKGPHSARHTVGINLYKKTNNLNLVKKVLGHRSISNTMIYAEYGFTKDEMRALVLG